MNPLLSLKNVNFKYPDNTVAIHDISFDIYPGQKIAVLGSNGSGKTSLFLILNGIHKISSGNFDFKAKPFQYSTKNLLNLRKSVGIVFQDPDTQIFASSVREEIAFGLLNLGLDEKLIHQKIESAGTDLHLMHLMDKPTNLLSYGEKRRVCIASILAMEPEILILDEPTSGLDPSESANLIYHLNQIHHTGKSIILSTHNVNLAYEWADNVIILKNGRKLDSGPPEIIFRNHELLKKANLEKPSTEEILTNLGLEKHFLNKGVVDKKKLIDFLKKHLKS